MKLRHIVIVAILLLMLAPLGSLAIGFAAGPAPLRVSTATAELPSTGDPGRGKVLYSSFCAGCHAPEVGLAPAHNTPSFRARYPTDNAIALVVRSGRHPMPGFTPNELSDQNLMDVISYLRSLPQQ